MVIHSRLRPLCRVAMCVAAMAAGHAVAGDLPPHPRLLLTPAAETRIRTRIETDPLVGVIRDALRMKAIEPARKQLASRAS